MVSGPLILFEGEWFVRLVLDRRLDHPPPFKLDGPHAIEVEFAPIEDAEERSRHHDCVRSIVRGRWSASKAVATGLENISRGLLPDGRDPEPAWKEFTTALLTMAIEPGVTRPYSIADLYPEHVRAFVRGVQTDLRDSALKILSIVRWRMDARGGHNPIRSERGLRFSLDGENTFPVHLGMDSYYGYSETHAIIESSIHDQITGYALNNEVQPIGQELLREAFTTREENPRSALIVAVAALEIGVKEYIAARAPSVEWLAFNLSSPPVVTLLTEYLPKLPAKNGIYRSPPDAVVSVLKKAITLRNSVAHKGLANIPASSLVEIMKTISDVLRILEYYRGYEWSRDYVTSEIARSWLDAPG